MKLTSSTEDYLKAIFHLSVETDRNRVGTNQLAEYMGISPASVSVMLKKLREQDFVDYEKYGKIELTEKGYNIAVDLIRKHRLWETFLYRHMNFSWDEVHEVAHELEHIQSSKLIVELDNFLEFPELYLIHLLHSSPRNGTTARIVFEKHQFLQIFYNKPKQHQSRLGFLRGDSMKNTPLLMLELHH